MEAAVIEYRTCDLVSRKGKLTVIAVKGKRIPAEDWNEFLEGMTKYGWEVVSMVPYGNRIKKIHVLLKIGHP